jgi:hypothetical protein
MPPAGAKNSVVDLPAATLLRSWGKRMANGHAVVIPVFVGGSWTLQVPRGNKRVLRLNVPNKKQS